MTERRRRPLVALFVADAVSLVGNVAALVAIPWFVLQETGRPLICTEYMARTRGSLFETSLPIFKRHGVGALNWGLVKGKTNTIFAWDTPMPDRDEPPVWFHDLFRPDGTPFKQGEVEFLKTITARPRPRRRPPRLERSRSRVPSGTSTPTQGSFSCASSGTRPIRGKASSFRSP